MIPLGNLLGILCDPGVRKWLSACACAEGTVANTPTPRMHSLVSPFSVHLANYNSQGVLRLARSDPQPPDHLVVRGGIEIGTALRPFRSVHQEFIKNSTRIY
jgi:hypothetical protein